MERSLSNNHNLFVESGYPTAKRSVLSTPQKSLPKVLEHSSPLIHERLEKMVVKDRQKNTQSPKSVVGEIDTSALFQHVKDVVNLFGEDSFSGERRIIKKSNAYSAENSADSDSDSTQPPSDESWLDSPPSWFDSDNYDPFPSMYENREVCTPNTGCDRPMPIADYEQYREDVIMSKGCLFNEVYISNLASQLQETHKWIKYLAEENRILSSKLRSRDSENEVLQKRLNDLVLQNESEVQGSSNSSNEGYLKHVGYKRPCF